MDKLANALFLIIIFIIYGFNNNWVHCYKFNLGTCLVYYDEPCQSADIQFYLHTTSNTNIDVHILNPFKPILPYDFDRTIPTKMLVHGYGGLTIDVATKNVTQAYRELGYNVIVVDWSAISLIPCYPAAFLNTWHVGQCTAILVASLAGLGITPDQLHVLGFSLGAHVAGFASNHLQKTLGIQFGRITGLDPALPFFATLHHEWKLDKADATFVDVIHTSAGSFGKIEAAGHIDFYINGGTLQPACVNAPYPPLCSHLIAGLYFAETIRNKKHYGIECQSIIHYNLGLCRAEYLKRVIMGEYTNPKSRGIYFVDIPVPRNQTKNPPYYYYK